MGMMARVIWSYLYLRRLKRRCSSLPLKYQHRLKQWLTACGFGRTVRLGRSPDIHQPLTLGLITPIILFPETLADRLTDAEVDQVGLHELAHLRRWDDWTNLVQKLAEAAFFFHPAVLWIGRRLNLEREIACDDWVVSLTGERRSYAACLTKLVELTTWPQRLALAPGAVMTRKQLSRRIEMLLDRKRNATPRLSKLGFLATLGVLIVAVAHCAQVSPVIAVPERTLTFAKPADQKEEPVAGLPSKVGKKEIHQTQQNEALKQQDAILKQRDQALREQAEALERLQVEALKQQDQAVRQQAEVLWQQAEALKQQEQSLFERSRLFSFGGEERKPAIPESELLPLLISIARTDANADVRKEAIKAIGRLESDASIDALLELYDALGDVSLKQEVIAHLLRWKGDNAKALAKLTQIAKTSSDLELRTAAFRQLAGVQGDAGAEALISIYDASSDVKVKESIIHYLGLNSGKKAVQKLMVIAKSDPDAKMRLLAVRRLGSLDEAWPYHLVQGVVRGVIAPEPSESPEPSKPAEPPKPPR
jgi:hypothetical protein